MQHQSHLNLERAPDFEKMLNDLEKGVYPYIGSGSGRMVFDLGNGTVVKVAKNKKGTGQNKAEYNISQNDNSELFAKVFCISKKYTFLIMEKAEKVKNISFVWNYFHVKSNRQLFRVKALQALSYQHRLILPDLGRPENWGKINGRPVIVDFGFTREVQRRFYATPLMRIFRR